MNKTLVYSKNIEEIRKVDLENINQTKLGKKFEGKSQDFISKLERGESDLKIGFVKKLCDITEKEGKHGRVREAWLAFGELPKYVDELAKSKEYDKNFAKHGGVQEIVKELAENDKESIYKLIEILRSKDETAKADIKKTLKMFNEYVKLLDKAPYKHGSKEHPNKNKERRGNKRRADDIRKEFTIQLLKSLI